MMQKINKQNYSFLEHIFISVILLAFTLHLFFISNLYADTSIGCLAVTSTYTGFSCDYNNSPQSSHGYADSIALTRVGTTDIVFSASSQFSWAPDTVYAWNVTVSFPYGFSHPAGSKRLRGGTPISDKATVAALIAVDGQDTLAITAPDESCKDAVTARRFCEENLGYTADDWRQAQVDALWQVRRGSREKRNEFCDGNIKKSGIEQDGFFTVMCNSRIMLMLSP